MPLVSPGQRTKPPVGAVIDWAHPRTQGLKGEWLHNEGSGISLRNLVDGGKGTLNSSVWGMGKDGGHSIGYAANQWTTLSRPCVLQQEFTLICRFFLNTNTISTFVRTLMAHGQWGADANGDTRLEWSGTGAGGGLSLHTQDSAGHVSPVDSIAMPTGRWVWAAGTYRAGVEALIYRDGLVVGSAASSGAFADGGSRAWQLGAYPNKTDTTNMDGFIDYAAVLNRAVPRHELWDWYNEPYAHLRSPDVRRRYF